MIGFIANRSPCIWWDGYIDHDLAQEFTVSVKYLNSMIPAVGDIDIVLRVNSDAVRSVELTRLVPWFTPRLQPIAILIDLGNSRVYVPITYISVARGIPSHIGYLSE